MLFFNVYYENYLSDFRLRHSTYIIDKIKTETKGKKPFHLGKRIHDQSSQTIRGLGDR
jgi:hypothetical protein